MVLLLTEVFCLYQHTCSTLLALSFGRILKLYGFLLVLTTHQIGYWKLFCFTEGGATTQVCDFSLSYRPCLFSEHIPVHAFCISHVHWGKNVCYAEDENAYAVLNMGVKELLGKKETHM